MAKIVLITDTHFGVRNDNQILAKYFTKFYQDVFFPKVDEIKPDAIIHLGDVVDRRKYINFLSSNQLKDDFILPIYNRKIPLYTIVGNHDIYFRNNLSINAVDQLYNYTEFNIQNIMNPTEITIGGVNILLMPWICNENKDLCYEVMTNTSCEILMGHFEINGFEMHKGTMCESGIDTLVFNKFDMVFSGHFHHKSSYGNINYLGSPYEMTWSDYNDPRGFHVFDTEKRDLTFIENPYRLFHRFEYDDTNLTIEDLDELNYELFENTYMKVIVKNKSNSYLFSLFIERLSKANVFNLQIIEDFLNLDIENGENIADQAKSTIDILHDYVESIETKMDKKKLNGLFHTLYQEALNTE